MNLGELVVELCADTSQLEKSLEQAKKSAYAAASSIEKSFGNINLGVNVDDSSLTDLNKHLNLKVQHLKEVNKYFNNNPIVVNVDDASLTDLNKHLNQKVQHLKEVNKYFNNNPIVVNTDVAQLDELEKRLGGLSNKTITITVESELSNQLEKSLTDAVQSAVRDAVSEQSTSSQQQQQKESASSNRPQRVDVVASPMRSIVDGLFEGVGKKLTKGLDRSIEDAVGVNMDTMTRISGNMLLRYFGVGKKAQSDPKNEQKRVETIVKDGVSAFIRSHDGKAAGGGTRRGRTVRSTNDDDIGVAFDSVSRIASNSADIRQENSGVISRTFSEINTAFSDSINISVESIAQRAKLATIRQVRKSASSVTQNSSLGVQNAVSGFFDATESGKSGAITKYIGQGLASQSKKTVETVFSKIFPNVSSSIKGLLGTGLPNQTSATNTVKYLPSNKATDSSAIETIPEESWPLPKQLPAKENKIPLLPPAKKRELEPITVNIPEQIKPLFQTIQSEIVKNIDISQGYKDATSAENKLIPLPPVPSDKTTNTKKYAQSSLDEIDKALTSIKKYFADEYKRIQAKVKQTTAVGTHEEIKSARAEVSTFVKKSREAVATVDRFVKTGEDAGFSKDSNSELSAIHSKGKAPIARNASSAEKLEGKLNLADKKLFDQQLKGYIELAQQHGVEIPKGLQNGIKHGAGGVSDTARIMLDDLIKTVKTKMQIQSPSWLMFELGLMITSGLFLGMQKGNSKVAQGARQIVDTVTDIVGAVKTVADPALGAASVIPGLTSISTYGSAGLSATDTGLKILSKVGERHAVNPSETLFQSVGGSAKDFVDSIVADKTLTKPREAFDHTINIVKAGALGLGANPVAVNAVGAAQSGMTALLRNSAITKAITQSHGQTKAKLQADTSLDYMSTFKSVLNDNLKDLKLSKSEIVRAISSVMKVVPTGLGTGANSNFATASYGVDAVVDTLSVPLALYRKSKSKVGQGLPVKDAIASSVADDGAPQGIANVVGSLGAKLHPSLNNFIKIGKQTNEGLSQGILSTIALSANAINTTGDAIQNKIKQNMGISSPSKVMIALGVMIASGLAIGIKQGVIDVSSASQLLTNEVYKIKYTTDKTLANKSSAVGESFKGIGESDKSSNPLVGLLSAIKKDFSNDTILGKLVNSAKSAFSKGGSLKDIGINLITSFGQGFLSANGGVLGIVTKFATGILSTIKKVFRIASPSGEGIDVGENIAGSTGTGIDNKAHVAVDAARRMAESVNDVLHKTLILTPGQSKGTTGSLILPNTSNLRTRELILPTNYQRPQSQRIGLDTLPLDRLFRPVIQKLTQPEARLAAAPVLRSSVPVNSLVPQIKSNTPNNLDQVVQQQIKTLAASVVSLQQTKFQLPIDYTGPLILPTSVKPELQNLSILPVRQRNPYSGEIITPHATAHVRQPELILPQNYLRSQSRAISLNTLPIDRLFRPLVQKLTRLNDQLPSTAVLRSNLPTTNSNSFTRPVFPNNIQEALATPPRTRLYNGPLVLPNSARPDLQNLKILPAIQSNPYTGSILTPKPLSRYRPIITAPNQPIANPDANLILPNQISSAIQRLILPRLVTRPPIRINLDALASGNMSQLFNRYPQIPDPWATAPGRGVINFPAPQIPIPPVPPIPPIPPIPPAPTIPTIPVPQNLISQYTQLGSSLITNLFTAVSGSIRQSTLSGYASLGQVMRNAVNAALFSLADTLKQPLYQGLLSQTRSMLPWFMKFIPRSLQLLPMLKPLMPVLGGLTLGLGNSIVKNLLNNDVLKPGGFLTKLLSSITKIDLTSLSGGKAHGIMSGIAKLMNPIPGFVNAGGVTSVGLGMAGMFMNTYGGILGLDQSTNPNPRKQAPTIEKVLQDQTIANRKKAGLGNVKGTQASQQLIENLGNTTIDSILENLNIPMIPTSVIQGLTGNKLKQQSGTIAGVLNSLGVERSRAEQLLEKTVKSGRTDVGRRTDILTKQVLRERGLTQQQRDSMTPKELTAARENILKSPLDLTKRESRLLQFMGDFETHINNMGSDAAFKKGNAMVMSVLKERGLSYAERQVVKQSQGGLGQVAGSLISNPRTGGFVGRLTKAYAGNDQEAMKGLLLEGLKKAGMPSQRLKNIDPKLLDTATAGLMASLTGLQAKFKEKGFDMGKAITQGFKDSVRNLANAKDDLEYNAKKALGNANFGDAVGVIFKRMSRGTVATQDQFKEMYNQMGSGVKKALFSNPKEADATFPNVLQFMGSIAATMAPITTLFASLTPLFLPLAPIIGGIGAAVSMVAPHISRMLDGIQRVEVLQRRFTFLGGSKAGGDSELKYAKDIANKMNVPSEVAANAYSQLAIAAKDSKMEGQGVKDLFEGITASLSALGINGQDASLVFMAYTQILSKGKLSMEELRQQLGEKFPPAMGVFAKAMGVAVPEMSALISSGSVLSQDILPKVAKVLKEDYGKSAAGQAGGLVIALNKLGNVGFEITSIFTDKLGGTLGFFVSTFADGLSLFSKSLGALIPLGQSFAIGFAATIAIGLTTIMTKFKPLVTILGSLQSLLMATFSVVTTNMMPMIIGVTADIADNWLGAEKDMMANMKDGITNMVVATFSTIDSVMRSMSDGNVSFSSMFGSLVQGAEQAGSMIDWLKGVFAGFFKVIPPGFIELLSMVFMFEQGAGLAIMALAPAFKGFFGALTGMLGGAANAFVGVMTSMKVASELMMTSMSAAITAGEARIKIFSATLGFLRTALTHIGVAFAILMFSKGDFSNPMGDSLKEATKELNNGLTEIRANVQKTADSFDKATNNVKKLGGSLADTLPSKGVQLDIRSFWGGGDFKWDDAIKARNKGEASPVMDTLGVGALGLGAGGATFAGIKMLSAALVPIAANAAATALAAAQAGSLSMTAASIPFMGKLAMALVPILANPLGAIAVACVAVIAALTAVSVAFDLFAPKLTEKQKEFLNKSGNEGIKSYFDTEDPNARLTNAQQQIYKYFEDQEKNIANLKEFADSQGFTGKPSDLVADIKPLTTEQQQKFNTNKEIASLNRQIEDNNNKRLALLADARKDGASPQELKDIQNSPNFKNLENKSKEMRNAVALAAADFQIGESPENKKNLKDIDKQIAKKQAELKKFEEESRKAARASSFAAAGFGGDFAPMSSFVPSVSGDPDKIQKELADLEAKKTKQSDIIKASIQRAFDFKEIKNVDKQLEEVTKQSIELNKAVPSDKVRKEQGAVKQLIQQLYKKREDLVNSFGSPLPRFEQMLKQEEEYKQKLISGAVEGVKGQMLPAAVKGSQARIDQLKTMIAGAKPFDVRPIEEALYTQATNAVRDATTRFERATSANKIKSNLSQAKIYSTSGTSQQIAPELATRQLADLTDQRGLLAEKLKSDQAALNKLNQALVLGGTNLNEVQAEFDKLIEEIAKNKESLSQNSLEIIKAQRDMRQALIDQTKQVADYYRTSVREAQSAGIEFEKATVNLEGQQIAAKLRKAITGAGNNLFTNFVDSLIGIVQQVTDIQNTELDKKKQEIDYRNNLEDINLKVLELQRSIPGKIVPFDISKVTQFNKEIKNIQNSVQEINKEISKVGKNISTEPVSAAMKLNDVLVDVIKNLEKINSQGSLATQSNQTTSEPWLDVVSDMPVQPQTQTIKPISSSFVEPSKKLTALLSKRPEILVASLDSDVYGIPSFTKQDKQSSKKLIAPNIQQQTQIIPINSFVSPIGKTKLEDILKLNYAPKDKLGRNGSDGIYFNQANLKSGSFREVVASLTGVASILGKTLTITTKAGKKKENTVEVVYEGLNIPLAMRYLGIKKEGEKANVSAGQTVGLLGRDNIKFSVAITTPNGGRSTISPLTLIKDLYRVNEKESPSFPEKVWRKLFDPIIQTVWKLGIRPYRGLPVDNTDPKVKFMAQPVSNIALPGVPPNSNINQTPPQYPAIKPSTPLPTVQADSALFKPIEIFSNWTKENPLLNLQAKPVTSNTSKVLTPATQTRVVNLATQQKPVTPAIKPVVITIPPTVNLKALSQFPQPLPPTNTLSNISTSATKIIPAKNTAPQISKIPSVKKTMPLVSKGIPTKKPALPESINSITKAAEQGLPTTGNLQPGIGYTGKVATAAATKRKEAADLNTKATALKQRSELYRNLESLLLNFQGQLADLPNTRARDELDIQKLVLSIKFPNATPDQRYKTELDSFNLNINEQTTKFQKRIRENEKIKLKEVTETLNDLKKEFTARGIKYDFSNLDKMAKVIHGSIKNQIASDKNQLALLKDPKLRAAFDANFKAQEATRKTDLKLSGMSITNEQLQEQLNLYKQLEKSDPLSPLLLEVPTLEHNLSLLKLQYETTQKLNELEKEWYTTGGAMGKAEYDRRKLVITDIVKLKEQSLDIDLKASTLATNSKMVSDLLSKSQFIQDSIRGVADSRSSLLKGYGLDFRAEKLDKQSALTNQQMESAKATIQLDEFVKKNELATGANKLTNEQINELRENLKKMNEYKLEAIKQQFSELGAVIKGVSSSFKSGFKEFLLSTKDIGKSSADLFDAIAKGLTDTLAEIASKRMTDALFGWTEGLLGGNKSKGGLNPGAETTMRDIPGSVPIEVPKIETAGLETASLTLQQAGEQLLRAATTLSGKSSEGGMGGLGGAIFEMLGFGGSSTGFSPTGTEFGSDGFSFGGGSDFGSATLPAFAEGGIVGVMNKERSLTGRKPHLIVASEGERVLNHKQTAIWNKLQGSVANFASGGVVGASGNGNIASKMGSTTTINVPVSVAVGSDSEVDTGRLSQAVQAMVSDGIRREMRTGGSINRGNPYGR